MKVIDDDDDDAFDDDERKKSKFANLPKRALLKFRGDHSKVRGVNVELKVSFLIFGPKTTCIKSTICLQNVPGLQNVRHVKDFSSAQHRTDELISHSLMVKRRPQTTSS